MGDSKNQRQKVKVFNDVFDKLRKLDFEEANEPGFGDDLWAHFTMLPYRYALDVNTERVEDVLMHKKLMNMARDPLTRPAVDVRLVQVCTVFGDSVHSSFTAGGDDGPLHEITISTKDKPKHLSGLSSLMSGIGLTIQEAHAFCTVDGYSFIVFVVDSWKEGIEQLKNTLVKKIQDMEVPNNMNSDDN